MNKAMMVEDETEERGKQGLDLMDLKGHIRSLN